MVARFFSICSGDHLRLWREPDAEDGEASRDSPATVDPRGELISFCSGDHLRLRRESDADEDEASGDSSATGDPWGERSRLNFLS